MKTREEIQEKAEHYVIAYGGNILTVGPTFFDGKENVWVVPIFYGSKFANFPLDEMRFNADGDLIYAPSMEKIEKLIELRFGKAIESKISSKNNFKS